MQQERDRAILDRNRSPYDNATRAPRDPRGFEATGATAADSRYRLRQTQEMPGSSLQDSLYKVDERHDELRRQIALKEKLLADMQSERESTRAHRFNMDPNQRTIGTMGSLNNRDRSNPDAPVPGPFGDNGRGSNYPLRGSPHRERSAHERPMPGFTDGIKSSVPSTQITRAGPVSFDGTGADQLRAPTSVNYSPEQKQLQFYPPHRSNFAKTYKQSSPLRNRSSGSRSKSRSTSNNPARGIRAS